MRPHSLRSTPTDKMRSLFSYTLFLPRAPLNQITYKAPVKISNGDGNALFIGLTFTQEASILGAVDGDQLSYKVVITVAL